MSRKFFLSLVLAGFTGIAFWYGARSPEGGFAAAQTNEMLISPSHVPVASPVTVPLVQPVVPKTVEPASAASVMDKSSTSDLATPIPRSFKPDMEVPAKIEADGIALNIRHYSLRFGGNPVGSNAEIVKEMTGGNPKGATYLPPELQRLNDQGELIDSWGTPYFFHQNSANFMEVRSAGPDKKLWTIDDVKTR